MAEQAPVRSFAQAAATDAVFVPVKVVQIDALVVLQILKHGKEASPQIVTGSLLGLDVGKTMEVTHSFPFPTKSTAEDDEEDVDVTEYQLEMMRSLREINVDNNIVGWYQSTYNGVYQSLDLVELFLRFQEDIKKCVCIIFDPQTSTQSAPSLKALKLKDKFMALYRSNNFVSEQLRENKLTWQDVFEELPVKVANSSLGGALITEMELLTPVSQADVERLSLSTNPFLEKGVEFVVDCLDDLSAEQQKLQFYARNVARQQAQQSAWLQKRRAENAVRKAAGEELLPEEDSSNPAFKPLPEPSRLEAYLISNQIADYCSQINSFGGPSLGKLYLMDAIHKS